MKKLFLIFLLAILLITPAFAYLGNFKQNECVTIKTILNTSAVNISTISNPNSSIIVSNVVMTKIGPTFYYSFCDTSMLGNYAYDYFDTEGNVYNDNFDISVYGQSISFGTSIIILLAVLTIIIFAGFLLLLGYMFDGLAAKIFFMTMTGICLLFAIAISINAVQGYLTEFSGLSTIVNYFWYLIMVLVVGGLILGCFWAILYAIDQIKISKGIETGSESYRDED